MDLIPLLSGLGPWGVLLGVALTLGAQYLRNRAAPQPAPSPAPVPAPLPVPAPVPVPDHRPLLDAIEPILDALLALIERKAPAASGK